jgi:hypothetical protein
MKFHRLDLLIAAAIIISLKKSSKPKVFGKMTLRRDGELLGEAEGIFEQWPWEEMPHPA